jgi:hypothetical protein
MITTTGGFNTANARMAKKPIYAFTITPQVGLVGPATLAVYTTHDLGRAGITGTLPTYQPWLQTPKGASQSVDIVNGSSTVGALTCEVLDVGGAITAVVGQNTLEGSTVQLRVGYPGTAWSDFAILQTYMIEKINPSKDYTSIVFACRDFQWLQRLTIYTHPENGYGLSEANPWYLCGTPAEIFQAVCLFALEMTAAQIDRATMVALDSAAENNFGPWRPFQFAITKGFQAKQFLETQVLKASGMYQVVLPSGALSLHAMRPPAAGPTPVFTFTEANLVEFPACDRQPIVNQAVWNFDADPTGGNYANSELFLEETSISLYGQGQQFSVDSAGLRTELGAFGYSEWVTGRMFRRFSGCDGAIKGGAPLVTVRAFLMSLPVWLGDYVALTHTKMPDLTSGNIGVTNRIYEVVNRQPDYASGTMQYTLLDTGLTGAPAAGEFGSAPAHPFVIGTTAVY